MDRKPSEIYINFVEHQKSNIVMGEKLTPKELGEALVQFGEFLKTLEDDISYADYDEGKFFAGKFGEKLYAM